MLKIGRLRSRRKFNSLQPTLAAARKQALLLPGLLVQLARMISGSIHYVSKETEFGGLTGVDLVVFLICLVLWPYTWLFATI